MTDHDLYDRAIKRLVENAQRSLMRTIALTARQLRTRAN